MPKVLCVKRETQGLDELPWKFPESVEVIEAASLPQAVQLLEQNRFQAVYWHLHPDENESICRIFQSCTILDSMPDGVALLDDKKVIIRANQRLTSWFANQTLVGLNFYQAIGQPNILGPEPSPLSTALARQANCSATLQVNERYYDLNVAPVVLATDTSGEENVHLIVTLRDSTKATLQRQKLEALRQAGIALADLRPEEIFEMDVDHRIDLLKDNILHYTKDLLNFDVVEIRLVEQQTNRLVPLLSVGIDSEVSKMPLFASAEGNGVTGFVAATGNSYLCEDTTHDPLYLDGLIGAKSSLTVPLIYHDEVIGSFNVESPEIGAFDESDLRFVESFARDIAVALNTLELLAAQQTNAAQQSVEAIHAAVAIPVDEVLNDTVHVIESYIGHDPDVVKRLRSILQNARDIKQVIQKVGQKLAPAEALPAGVQIDLRPALKDKRILVIDADSQVRTSAHNLLDRYGCIVETAHEGKEAILMVRNCGPEHAYDAIISDIRLPDIGGYDLLMQLKEVLEQPPLILMTGFGYDPGHSIVKARKAGLRAGAVLYKPFRLDQLLTIVESIMQPETVPTSQVRS